MTEVTASMVKQLRDQTSAGMMDCKKALVESQGDFEKAVDWLRAKGLSAAAKKAGRVAAEGLVGVVVSGPRGAIVEVNSETDFVAKNDRFRDFVRLASELALEHGGDVQAILATPAEGGSVQDVLTANIAAIGEKQDLRRADRIEVSQGVVASYVHNAVDSGAGKIGVLVALESSADPEKLAELGRKLAMHIAAAKPLALAADDLDPAILEREKRIAQEKAEASGKPAEIIEKMIEGGLRKFAKENTLMGQVFVMDGKTLVSDVLAQAAKDLGAPVVLKNYISFHLGEGIEKQESDFAAEVAAQAKGS